MIPVVLQECTPGQAGTRDGREAVEMLLPQ